MASLDFCLNPIYTIKECSSCGALYNKSCGCSKGGFVDKFVRDLNKPPDSSQRPPHNCPKYGNSIDGLYCQQCALLRKKLKEVWFKICDEYEIFQDSLNTFESSNDNTNIVIAPQKPFVFNQDPGKNSSQSPPHIDHHCCYGCGDSLDDIFCQQFKTLMSSNKLCQVFIRHAILEIKIHSLMIPILIVDDFPNPPPQPLTYSYEFCGNDAHYGHDCPPQSVIDYLKTHEDLQQRMNDSMIKLRKTFQAWLQHQVVNLDSYTPEPSQCQKIPIYYDDDDDEESSTPLRDIIIYELPSCIAITPSSVENLVPNPNDSEDLSNIRSECNMPVGDDFIKFSNSLFDADEKFSSSDDESFSDEDVPKKIYLSPLFDEEIISIKIDPHHFNVESDLMESLLNQDSLIISSSKIDSLLEEFSGELAHTNLIPPGINEADFNPEEEIRLVEKLLYDNSSPRPLKKPISENSNVVIESFSPNDSPLLPKNGSFLFAVPTSPRPHAKPPDDGGFYFDDEPDMGLLTTKMVGDISKQYA
uniref:Uncharacterized protein n=1 Tax=Tanacetum cinerariifolium TaxID=118510 RepID=A0A699JAG4_TANCI|nr:hypothetical protein [Tanacetum cinerariifolium]